jgi:hypothetical protein
MAEHAVPADDGTAGRTSSVDEQVDSVIDLRDERVIDLRRGRGPEPQGDVRRRRQQLVRYIGPSTFPASRRDLVDAVRRSHAPEAVVELVVRLPHGRYACEDDVLSALGLERRRVRR